MWNPNFSGAYDEGYSREEDDYSPSSKTSRLIDEQDNRISEIKSQIEVIDSQISDFETQIESFKSQITSLNFERLELRVELDSLESNPIW